MKDEILLGALLFVSLFSACWAVEGVPGLNGFVKESDSLEAYKEKGEVGLDLSKAKVALYNRAGIRKYEAECAPNGYFFIPVYEAGSFVAKVKGPGGWFVSPSKMSVECTQEGCAQGKDVNFEVVGFSLRGKIKGADVDGCTDAPSSFDSVTVNLSSKGGSSRGVSAKASADGQFVFSKLLPGDYLLTAIHPTWSLSGPSGNQEIAVTVGWEGVQLEESFKIQGYQVSGRVMAKNNPAANVQVVMYSSTAGVEVNCRTPASEFQADESLGYPICEDSTTENGDFAFSSIPCGQYHVVPRYSTPSAEFELSPSSVPIMVGHGNTQLGTIFHVVGFSLAGKVVHTASGKGVKAVHLFINGEDVGMTDEEGHYRLSKLNEGIYSISARKENMMFTVLKDIEVTSHISKLPDITSTQYKSCGAISLTSKHVNAQQKILVKHKVSADVQTVMSEATGEFCFWAKPGAYSLSPDIASQDKSKGLILGPLTREIEIIDSGVDGIMFTEKRLSLVVSVTRLSDEIAWGDLEVELKGADVSTVKATLNKSSGGSLTTVNKKIVQAKFDGLIPSSYTLKVKRSGWCWEKESITLAIEGSDKEAQPFIQKGFVTQVALSHSANLQFSGPGVERGLSHLYEGGMKHSICVGDTGVHPVIPSGCFKFEEDEYEFDPADGTTVDIRATHFIASGSILVEGAKELKSPVSLTITSQQSKQVTVVQASVEDSGILSYQIEGTPGDTLEIRPEHATLLFSPGSIQVVNSGVGCQPEPTPLSGKPGLFLTAVMKPLVAGVEVTLSDVKGGVVDKKITGKRGHAEFGPLELTVADYSLTTAKIGYEFEKLKSADETIFLFAAKELAKVEVKVELEGQDKEGILVILTGGDRYRSNAQTDAQGMVTFWDLPPATYYLKPVLKEYEFNPSLIEVNVEDGKDEVVTFNAKRTAFSVSGTVKTFTDKAIGGVTIEAAGPGDLYESTMSNEDGSYRVRGLIPQMEYKVRVVPVDGIERGWPPKLEVSVDKESLADKSFTVFMLPEVRRVTGAIKMNPDLVNQTSLEIVKVPSGRGKAELIDTGNLDVTRLFDFGVPNGQYVIRATSKTLATTHKCNFELAKVAVGKDGPSQVHLGEIEMVCVEHDSVGGAESGNRWPVVVAILAVAGMQWRQRLQSIFSSS